MKEWCNVKEALEILRKCYITSSEQMVTRWIRKGRIKAKSTKKKEGWKIHMSDLEEFIEGLRPGLRQLFAVQEELQQLKEQMLSLQAGRQEVDLSCTPVSLKYADNERAMDRLLQQNQEMLQKAQLTLEQQLETVLIQSKHLQDRVQRLENNQVLTQEAISVKDGIVDEKVQSDQEQDEEEGSNEKTVLKSICNNGQRSFEEKKKKKVDWEQFQKAENALKSPLDDLNREEIYEKWKNELVDKDGHVKKECWEEESQKFQYKGRKIKYWRDFYNHVLRRIVQEERENKS